jgi:hypothetical protein
MATATRTTELAGQGALGAPAAAAFPRCPVQQRCASPEWHVLRVFGRGRNSDFDEGNERLDDL